MKKSIISLSESRILSSDSQTLSTATPSRLSRRAFMINTGLTLGASSLGLFSHPLLADARQQDRIIELYVPATGESIRTVIWTPTEGYISESIREISIVMRDRRNDKVKTIDKATLDIVAAVQHILQPGAPTEMISGYRSPETNQQLRRNSSGVAKESYHVKAMAVDIRMPDRGRSKLEAAAKRLRAGGVGRYRRNNFTHLDSGPVRSWG